MSRNILITGGAASGKSRWAATYFAACDYVLYLRAGSCVDEDTLHRIEFDNKKNMVEWDIVADVSDNPAEKITDHKFVIFDSLQSYTKLVMEQMCSNPQEADSKLKKEIEKRVIDDVMAMRDRIEELDGSMIIITLETGFSVTPQDAAQALFRQILGNVNQRIANSSDEVYFSASGIQFKIK